MSRYTATFDPKPRRGRPSAAVIRVGAALADPGPSHPLWLSVAEAEALLGGLAAAVRAARAAGDPPRPVTGGPPSQ
jgi:hypothetical protein